MILILKIMLSKIKASLMKNNRNNHTAKMPMKKRKHKYLLYQEVNKMLNMKIIF